jgi:hypothetical protein
VAVGYIVHHGQWGWVLDVGRVEDGLLSLYW